MLRGSCCLEAFLDTDRLPVLWACWGQGFWTITGQIQAVSGLAHGAVQTSRTPAARVPTRLAGARPARPAG